MNNQNLNHSENQIHDTQDANTTHDTDTTINLKQDNSQHKSSEFDDPNDYEEPHQPTALKKENILSASIKRITNRGQVRLFIFAGAVSVLALSFAAYKVISPKDELAASDSSDVLVPQTKAKIQGGKTEEQAQYMMQNQALEAQKAAQNDGTYIAPFIERDKGTPVDTFAGNPTQPGVELNNSTTSSQTIYTDQTGKKYTQEEAAALSAQGKIIQGVTVGAGSINDTSSYRGNIQAPQSTLKTESYTVKPYIRGSSDKKSDTVALNESSTKAIDTLNKADQDSEQWKQQYLALRQKKADQTEALTQAAFQDQLKNLIGAVRPSKTNGKDAGHYSRNKYIATSNGTYQSAINQRSVNSQYNNVSIQAQQALKPLARVGDSFRAVLKTTVNTDEGTDILAQIQSGPLKGNTVMGTVKISENNIQFVFTKILRKNKDALDISGVGRQVGTNALGMADVINKHYLQKYSALAASSLLSGVGNAYEQTAGANTTTTNGTVVSSATEPSAGRIIGNAVGEVGSQISSDIKSLANQKTTYIANVGKVFNLFMMKDVYEPVRQPTQTNNFVPQTNQRK